MSAPSMRKPPSGDSHGSIRAISRRALAFAAAVAVGCGAIAYGYSTYAAKWATFPVPVYVNPQNLDVSAASALSAVQAGMNAWNTQAGSAFRYQYAGTVTQTTTGYDGRNVVLFRNASNGGALATTYSWWSGSTLLDSDIIFWDGGYRFFTGTSGCASGAYIEDIAVHELGHMLGLGHSSTTDASMYPSYQYCSQQFRTLASDDITGIRALYGTSTQPVNTAPVVAILAPISSLTVNIGTAILFSGTATDVQEGNIGSRLVWTSNLAGTIGSGASFSRTLPAGTHTIVAYATDSQGLRGSASVTVIVRSTTTAPAPTLTVSSYKNKRYLRAELRWSGFSSSSVDVYRNGVRVATTPNDGAHTDSVPSRGTYSYRACAAGTSTCSNTATVTF